MDEIQNLFDGRDFEATSNYYLDYILRRYLAENYGSTQDKVSESGPAVKIEKSVKRNTDFIEYTLKVGEENVLTFARVYGLKNIQRILNPVKDNKCKYEYIEVMSCPSGCLGGGGQIVQSELTMSDLKQKS